MYRFCAIVTVLALVACAGGSPSGDADGWVGERATEDGITIVRTLAGSVWNGNARLIEQASIGTADGADEYLFGRVRSIEVGQDRIYVLDSQIPVVRVYDWEGSHLLDIGGEGDGPGEFRQPEALAMHPDGERLFVRDGQTGRINIYGLDGDPLDRWMVRTGWNFGSRGMVFTPDGTLFTPSVLNIGAPVLEWRIGFVGYAPQGATGDTIAPPDYDFEEWRIYAQSESGGTSVNRVPFSPEVHWAFGADGTVVSGVSDRYRVDVKRTDGSRMRLIRDFDPVPVKSEEADWHRRAETANMQQMVPGWAWNGPGIPGHKAAYDELVVDLSGRVWVRRPGEGIRQGNCAEDPFADPRWYLNPCWIDSYVYEVFANDGRFLGEVEVPEGFSLRPDPYIRDELVVALVYDADDVPYVKRFRLDTAGAMPTDGGEEQQE